MICVRLVNAGSGYIIKCLFYFVAVDNVTCCPSVALGDHTAERLFLTNSILGTQKSNVTLPQKYKYIAKWRYYVGKIMPGFHSILLPALCCDT